jgi:hypothetical protein
VAPQTQRLDPLNPPPLHKHAQRKGDAHEQEGLRTQKQKDKCSYIKKYWVQTLQHNFGAQNLQEFITRNNHAKITMNITKLTKLKTL